MLTIVNLAGFYRNHDDAGEQRTNEVKSARKGAHLLTTSCCDISLFLVQTIMTTPK